MKELKQLFEGVAGIPEDFADKVETVFEAAVKEKAEELNNAFIKESSDTHAAKIQELEEAAAVKVTEQVEEALNRVDEYLKEAVIEWMRENAVALDSELKGVVAVQYMKGLKSLFSESACLLGGDGALTESYKKVIAKLEGKAKRLEADLSEATEAVVSLSKKIAFTEATDKLAMTTKDRVSKLAESISADNLDAYKTKLAYIIEAVADKATKDDKKEKQDGEADAEDEMSAGDAEEDDKEKSEKLSESQEKVLAAYRAAQAYL